MLPADWPGSTKKAAAAAEEDQVENEKLELAEARIKELEADRIRFAEADVDRFLSSDQATKKIPLPLLKAGDLKRVLLAAAGLDKATGKVTLAATDGKSEVESSLYEGIKKVLLALPDKITGADEEETVTAARAADEDKVNRAAFAGADKESVDLHFAVEKVIEQEKAKGNVLSYYEGVRRVEMARSGAN
jgi:hypothetical protein